MLFLILFTPSLPQLLPNPPPSLPTLLIFTFFVYPSNPLVLSIYSWGYGRPPEGVWLIRDYTLKEKGTSPFQLLRSTARGRSPCPPPLSMMEFGLAWAYPGPVHAVPVSWQLTLFPAVTTVSGSGSHWAPSSPAIPESSQRVQDTDVPFRPGNPTVSHALFFAQLWISVLITIYYK